MARESSRCRQGCWRDIPAPHGPAPLREAFHKCEGSRSWRSLSPNGEGDAAASSQFEENLGNVSGRQPDAPLSYQSSRYASTAHTRTRLLRGAQSPDLLQVLVFQLPRKSSMPIGVLGVVYHCHSLTSHDMLRLPMGMYEIGPGFQTRPEGHQAPS